MGKVPRRTWDSPALTAWRVNESGRQLLPGAIWGATVDTAFAVVGCSFEAGSTPISLAIGTDQLKQDATRSAA